MRVEVLNAAAERNAVDDVERLVARRERADAADAHVHRRAGSLLDATISTPATRPCSAFIGSVVGMSLSFSDVTVATAPVTVAPLLFAVADDDDGLSSWRWASA